MIRRLYALTGFKGKTLWDLLKLVIVPLTLLGASVLLNNAQNERQQREEDNRAAVQATVEAGRANANTLQAYYDSMAELILTEELKLETDKGIEARNIARARTLAALAELDAVRKGYLIEFLYESGLIGSGGRSPGGYIIDLSGAEVIPIVALSRADLIGVHLLNSFLFQAVLKETFLVKANLSGADLREANLARAFLHGADLSEADLSGAILSGALYNDETIWPDGFDYEAAGAEPVESE